MQNVVGTTPGEKAISKKLNKIDELLLSLRDKVRNGEIIEDVNMEDLEL